MVMEEITVIHDSQVYRFNGVLLGKNRCEKMYKTSEGKFIIFSKDGNDYALYTFPEMEGVLESGVPEWVAWAGLDFPEYMINRL